MTSLNVPDNLKVSFYLLKQCKLWVWDFDDTLIDSSIYLKKNMTPDAILKRCDDELDVEIPQWRYFRKLVEFLVMHGRYVSIASFGTYEIIQAYMKRIMGFNQQFFTKNNIIAPCIQARDTFRFNIPPNKNEYIYKLMQIYRVQDFKRVVLFDDKPSNIADAIAIGIVAVQIAAPGNGDNPRGNMYFGPWVMDEFDKKIKNTCGEEIYKNRTYTGIAAKEGYTGAAFDGKDIDFGTGVDTDNIYKPVAFGTGIGDRKVLGRPQFSWNAYKNSPKKMPKWYNGNYVNIPGLVQTDGYWNEESALAGTTMSFWDAHQKVLKDNPLMDSNGRAVQPQDKDLSDNDDTIFGVSEGFSSVIDMSNGNGDSNSCGCKKFEWNWIILLLVLVIVIMIVIIIKS